MSFTLPFAYATPIDGAAPSSLATEVYSVDADGSAAELPSIEPFSGKLTRSDIEKFNSANAKFTGYLTPAAQRDAKLGNCEIWSSLLVIVKDNDFKSFIRGFNKPTSTRSAFIYFLGSIAGPRHYKIDPKFNFKFDRPIKGKGVSLQTRQGKTLRAHTAKELGEQMLAEIKSSEKTIFLGSTPDLKTYVESLPSGMYALELQFIGESSSIGHQITLSISTAREYFIFDTMQKTELFISFEGYLKWLNAIKPRLEEILISLTAYSPELLAHPIDIKRIPTYMDLLAAFYKGDHRSCKDLVVAEPALLYKPLQLFTTAIFYKKSLAAVRFLHEELGFSLDQTERFERAPPTLRVSGIMPTHAQRSFFGNRSAPICFNLTVSRPSNNAYFRLSIGAGREYKYDFHQRNGDHAHTAFHGD